MQCPIHGVEFRFKEGGISKMGKPYQGFWSCPMKNADGTFCNQKPPKDTPRPAVVAAPQQPSQMIFEQKDRLSAAQTCLNCVANLYQGKGETVTNEQIKSRFVYFYGLLRGAKQGTTPDAAPEEMPLEDKLKKWQEREPIEVQLDDIPF
jgi:hypothetical protein